MPSNSKEYAKNYYENNKKKLKQYYLDNKDNFKKNYENIRDKIIDANSEHFKIFIEYINFICISNTSSLKNNDITEYLIDSNIYKNEFINKYIDDNIKTIKKHFYNKNWTTMMKSKKLPNQILKRMCKTLSIETRNIIKSVHLDNKQTTNTYILINF
jgi:hypothetical protein